MEKNKDEQKESLDNPSWEHLGADAAERGDISPELSNSRKVHGEGTNKLDSMDVEAGVNGRFATVSPQEIKKRRLENKGSKTVEPQPNEGRFFDMQSGWTAMAEKLIDNIIGKSSQSNGDSKSRHKDTLVKSSNGQGNLAENSHQEPATTITRKDMSHTSLKEEYPKHEAELTLPQGSEEGISQMSTVSQKASVNLSDEPVKFSVHDDVTMEAILQEAARDEVLPSDEVSVQSFQEQAMPCNFTQEVDQPNSCLSPSVSKKATPQEGSGIIESLLRREIYSIKFPFQKASSTSSDVNSAENGEFHEETIDEPCLTDNNVLGSLLSEAMEEEEHCKTSSETVTGKVGDRFPHHETSVVEKSVTVASENDKKFLANWLPDSSSYHDSSQKVSNPIRMCLKKVSVEFKKSNPEVLDVEKQKLTGAISKRVPVTTEEHNRQHAEMKKNFPVKGDFYASWGECNSTSAKERRSVDQKSCEDKAVSSLSDMEGSIEVLNIVDICDCSDEDCHRKLKD